MSVPAEEAWEAADGTRWLYLPVFDEWTGWQPGEDGVWNLSRATFEHLYPEGPKVDTDEDP